MPERHTLPTIGLPKQDGKHPLSPKWHAELKRSRRAKNQGGRGEILHEQAHPTQYSDTHGKSASPGHRTAYGQRLSPARTPTCKRQDCAAPRSSNEPYLIRLCMHVFPQPSHSFKTRYKSMMPPAKRPSNALLSQSTRAFFGVVRPERPTAFRVQSARRKTTRRAYGIRHDPLPFAFVK